VVTSYRDLKVWKAAMNLAQLVYGETARFPQREAYGLRQQLERAAVSVPSDELLIAADEVGKMLRGVQKSLKARL
jgi:23S rRNA-intervening sequence protein